MQFVSFAQGRKTYILAAVGIALGIVQGLNDSGVAAFHVPAALEWILMFLGLAAARSGIKTDSARATADIVALVRDLLAGITIKTLPDLQSDVTGAVVRTAPIEVRALAPVRD